ncbi:MAG: glycosyltransferase family 2 protein [Pseudomonadota bacterium]
MSLDDRSTLLERSREAFQVTTIPDISITEDQVIALVIAHNEVTRLPYFLEHHRRIGIGQFIVIDNDSTDGTGAYLDAQADVTRIHTKASYKENKSIWRQLICDLFLQECWVLFPDVDELFWYPGLSKTSINRFTEYLDQSGYQGVFTTMVDMYAAGPVQDIRYEPSTPFLESCPYFDNSGYRYVPLKGADGRGYNVPFRHLYGGTRERLFHHTSKRKSNLLDKFLLGTVFSIRSNEPKTSLGRFLDRKLFKMVKKSLPGVDPLMSKVTLLKWEKGASFSGGVHNVASDLSLAPDWCALLHFKYLNDFKDKVDEALDRGQHAVSSRFYKDYVPHLDRVMSKGAYFEGSVVFKDENSLLEYGLMRKSGALEDFLAQFDSGSTTAAEKSPKNGQDASLSNS